MRTFKRLQKALETPKVRRERKAREYRLSLVRTIFSCISGLAAVVSLVISVLIFAKVWNR